MMKAGGPKGRAAMLAIDPEALDAKSREYYGRIHKAIEATTYDALHKRFDGMPGEAKLADDELKKRLATMYANFGKDDTTSPAALVNSGLPADFLVSQLTQIRSRMFNRVSNEALDDVEEYLASGIGMADAD